MSLNYFLNKKLIEQITDEAQFKKTFITSIPSSLKQKIKFEPIKEIEADKYLTNYLQAYNFGHSFFSKDLVSNLNIASLMISEELALNTSTLALLNIVRKIEKGYKPKTKEEKLIWNIIEAIKLVSQDNFEINEDNYELIVHVLFRNTEFNLDRKLNYYRNSNDNLECGLEIDCRYIDEEIEALLKFIKEEPLFSFDGFTKAIIIFYSVLIIQPYQKLNKIMAFVLSIWFLNESEKFSNYQIRIFDILNGWSQIVETIKQSGENEMDITNVLKITKEIIRKSINSKFIFNELCLWIQEDEEKRLKFFPTDYEYIVLVAILIERTKDVSIGKITDNLKINDKQSLKKNEIKNALENLKSAKILKNVKNETTYAVVPKELEKLKFILK